MVARVVILEKMAEGAKEAEVVEEDLLTHIPRILQRPTETEMVTLKQDITHTCTLIQVDVMVQVDKVATGAVPLYIVAEMEKMDLLNLL